MKEKNKTVINQLYRYYEAKEREDGEWFLPELPMLESYAQGLSFVAIADQLQRLVTQLRLPAGEWIEVTPETLPEPWQVCTLLLSPRHGRKMFAVGGVDERGEWYLSNFLKEKARPLFYMILPETTDEMRKVLEVELEAETSDEEL